jgi:hypothetical protein
MSQFRKKNLNEIEYLIQLVYKNLVENEYSMDGSRGGGGLGRQRGTIQVEMRR